MPTLLLDWVWLMLNAGAMFIIINGYLLWDLGRNRPASPARDITIITGLIIIASFALAALKNLGF